MKQYVHPILGRTITRHPRSFLGKEYYSVSSKLLDISLSVSEEDLLSLGFIEKEEEPNTKWIDDAYRQYSKGISILHGLDYQGQEDYKTFKKAILSHLPR